MTDSIDKKELKKIRDELFKQQQDFSLRIRNTTDPNRPPYGGPSWSERKANIARRVAREKLKKKKGLKEKPSLKLPCNKAARLVINIAAIVGWYALLRWVLIDFFYDLMRWINPEYNVFGVIPTVIDFLVIVIPIALVTKYIWFKKSRITTSIDD